MMNKKDFLIVAALILLPLGVYAADSDTTRKDFNKLDVNQDGYISQQEAQADKQLTDDWSKADKNQDGQIDISEFSAFEESLPPVDVNPD